MEVVVTNGGTIKVGLFLLNCGVSVGAGMDILEVGVGTSVCLLSVAVRTKKGVIVGTRVLRPC